MSECSFCHNKAVRTIDGYRYCKKEYTKIRIIEKSLNATHKKLMDALKNGASHTHKRNMIWTYKKLIALYLMSFYHLGSDYYNNTLKDLCLSRFEANEKLVKHISEILMLDIFTHQDHNILLRPYLFDFEKNCYIHRSSKYKYLRGKLESMLKELILKWYEENKEETEKSIDARVLNLIGIPVQIWHNNLECPICGQETKPEFRASETGYSYCSHDCAKKDVEANYQEGAEG